MYQVVKRDGKITDFEISKISMAITKAFEALEKQYHPSVIDMLALRVTAEYEPLIRDGKIAVETIQDCVEKVLSEAGYSDVAKAYILYRKQREKSAMSTPRSSTIRTWWTIISGSTTGGSRKTPRSPIPWAA